MAVAFVQQGLANPGTGSQGTTFTVALPAGLTAGGTLVLAVAYSAGISSVTGCGAAWTRKITNTDASTLVDVWVGTGGTAGQTTVTVNFTGTTLPVMNLSEWSGVASIANASGTANASATSAATPAVTPATGEVAYGVVEMNNNAGKTITSYTDTPSAWTTMSGGNSTWMSAAFAPAYIAGVTTSSTRQGNFSAATTSITQSLVLSPSAGTTHLAATADGGDITGTAAAPTLTGGVAHLAATGSAGDLTGTVSAGQTVHLYSATDDSNIAQVDIGGEATLDLNFGPPVIPPGITRNLPKRRSYSYSAPSVDTATGIMVKQTRTLVAAADWGYRQVILGGRDLTYHRGQRTKIGPMVWAVPGGPATVTLIFPAARPFEDLATALGVAEIDGAAANLYKRNPDDSRSTSWAWEGEVHAKRPVMQGDDFHWEVDIKGFLHQPEDAVNLPPFQIYSADEQDVGRRIAQVLNSWPQRDYRRVTPVDIGIPTLLRGSFGQSRMQMVQDLLAVAWTSDGRQWRVIDQPGPGRHARIELPDTTVDYHVSVGGDGVDLSGLVDEGDEAPNVIYGEWVDAQGNRSQNVKYPHLHEDTAPPYPLTDPAVFNPGDSHTGFQPFSDWLRDHGYAIFSQDSYDARDEGDVKAAQLRAGVTPDGVVGRQTWGQVFNTGANVGDLGAVHFAPLAADTRTQPRIWSPDGQDLGPNPAYDPTFPCREVKVDFGAGLSRAEVVKAARAILTRNTTGKNYAGTVTLTGDPEECSRLDIRHGNLIAVRYLDNSGSTGVVFHIAQVSHDDPESDNQPVTLTLDTRYRDAPTLTQMLENRREAKNDPARILRRQETGKQTQSTRTPFDRDNAAGKIYKHAIQSGYWRVVQFPAMAYGELVDLVAATSPAREFVLGLFVKPVTPNYLAAKVGNPLDPGSPRPFDVNRADLRAAGFIQGWGSGAQPGGYSDGYTGAKTAGDGLTGKIEDDAGTKYASFNPPWLWLAEYCAGGNTDITVTFRNAPEQV